MTLLEGPPVVETRKLANPLILLHDARLGLKIWGGVKGLKVSDNDHLEEDHFWAYIQQMYFGYLKILYPNVEVIDATKTSPQITRTVNRLSTELDATPVFLDNIIGWGQPLFSKSRLDIRRITDRKGTDLGLGPRPGTKDIETQLNSLLGVLKSQKHKGVLLVDDVVGPHAVTVQRVVELLKSKGISTLGVLAEASFDEGRKTLEAVGLPLTTISKDVKPGGDIINTSDLFPYLPGGGLKGQEIVYDPSPILKAVSYPYTPPFFPRSLYDRNLFTIPQDKEKDFGITFLTGSLMIFQHIREACGREITLGDLDSPVLNPTYSKDSPVEKEIAMRILQITSEGYMGLSSAAIK